MALTLSGTNGVVGAGFTLDASGASVTAGVGTFGSLNAPAAGLTGALPAISAASLTSIPAANIVGVCTAGFGNASGAFSQGTTTADQWYLTADFSGSVDPIQNNLSRFTSAGNLGSAMTVSSGIWTFPSTGFWKIDVSAQAYQASGNQSAYNQWRTILSTDNFSSDFIGAIADIGYFDNYNATRFGGGSSSVIFDVTNVSTHKLKFLSNIQDGATMSGHSTIPSTMFQFVRLGDT